MQSTKIPPFTVWFEQSEEFHLIKREIFTQGSYYVELDSAEPVIIDAGAHIGLATLYFKKMYPKSKIWAIEPLKENFRFLQKNIEENFLEDVTTIHAALTGSGDEMTLHLDATPLKWWSTAGHVAQGWNRQQQTQSRTVPAVQLSTLIQEIGTTIDFLKMDIEGSELDVLKEAQSHLGKIQQMMIEFHPIQTQSLRQLVTLLENCGFSYDLWQDGKAVSADRFKGLVLIHAVKNS